MRPILFDVDAESTPPRMTILFPDRPRKFIVVTIKASVATKQDAQTAAARELEGFTSDQLQLLAESAQPMPVAAFDDVESNVEQLEQEQRWHGMVHCPACCHALGRGDSPSIGYLERCSTCGRRIMVRFAPGTVTVVLWTE